MTQALAVRKQVEFSDSQIELVKKTIMPPVKYKSGADWVEKPATQDELDLFLYVCGEKNLNPLTREIYAMRNKEGKLTFMTSIDGLRIQAERTQVYAGQKGPFWCGEDGVWKDVWLEDSYPAAAKVGVLRHGFVEPVWGIAKFKSYAQWMDEWLKGPDGKKRPTGKKVLVGFWAKGDEHMLAKCAEAIALRKAFPTQMGESGASALYIAEEAHAIAREERGSKEAAMEVAAQKVAEAEAMPRPPKAEIPPPPEIDLSDKLKESIAHVENLKAKVKLTCDYYLTDRNAYFRLSPVVAKRAEQLLLEAKATKDEFLACYVTNREAFVGEGGFLSHMEEGNVECALCDKNFKKVL